MRYFLLLICILLSQVTLADCLLLKDNAPLRYVVKKNDTLWGIASLYLQSPWQWKALLHANPTVKNPNRLYVGTILELHFRNKQPYLKTISNGVVKLSPTMKMKQDPSPVPAIPLGDVEPFLNGSFVLDQAILTEAPYVIAFTDEHLMGGQGDEIYIDHLPIPSAIPEGTTLSYAIFRPGKKYVIPHTEEVIGYLATLIGHGDLVSATRPATLLLTDITEGVNIQDRVVLDDQAAFDPFFEPETPQATVEASIIDLLGDYTQGSVGFIAVIDHGADIGLRPGDVLAINARTHYIVDPIDPERHIKLPPKRIGDMMIFRVFSHTSFALIVRSVRVVHLLDKVTNP